MSDSESNSDHSSGQGTTKTGSTVAVRDGSTLFQPHRTIGLITTSRPFTISNNATNHMDTFLTVPLQERFVIYKCDSLKPVLVSDALTGTKTTTKKKHSITGKGERMYHAISDSSLGLTIATHSYKGRWAPSHVSLYKRTKTIDVRQIVVPNTRSNDWGIVDVVNLGRSKFNVHAGSMEDKEKKMENCMVLAFICARNSLGEEMDGVQVVDGGESDDDDDDNKDTSSTSSSEDESGDDSDSDSGNSDSDESDDGDDIDCNGEVVIVIASRTKLTIQKRILIQSIPDFTPSIAVHPHTYVNKILIGGSGPNNAYLTGGGGSTSIMILLNIRSGKVIHEFKCLKTAATKYRSGSGDKITALEQSPAVDTVAVGTESGMVHLVNIRMDKTLFSLTHGKGSSKNTSKHAINSLSFRTDALALEHGIAPLAVGQMNGAISIWDLTPRSDDDSDDESSPLSRNARRTLLCQMEKAHPGGVSKLKYLPQEPLLLSSGHKSNNLIMHIFDNPNHTGRILRQRVGHVAPPCLIRYQHSSNGGILASMADGTDAASCQILSCGGKGDNSLRVFSTARSVLDREYSQGKGLERKARELDLQGGKSELLLKQVIGLASCETKSRDWGDLVSIHKDHAIAYVWSTKKKAQSGPVLRQDEWSVSAMKVQPPKTAHATSVAMSSCGNFAVVGTKGGVIYKYNVQSGLPRGSFPRDATISSSKAKKNEKIAGNINRTTRMLERTLKIHKLNDEEVKGEEILEAERRLRSKLQRARHVDASVVGLAVDTLNRTLVSVGSDSKLILWSFTTHAPHRRSPIGLSAPATKMVHSRDSDLLAIALEDYSINLFDFSSLSVVRRFSSIDSRSRHTAPITDIAFGPDGRKLFTSSFDGTLRVWDVPTNTCVDWMTFASPPTSLTLNTTGEFLATSHQGRLGISLWCDKSFFQTVHIDGARPPTKPFQMDEPVFVAEEEDTESLVNRVAYDRETVIQSSTSKSKNSVEDDTSISDEKTVQPKRDGLITLSGLPAAHWKNLFHLELVKERNKPSEEVKKAPDAPFFLQWRGAAGSAALDTLEAGNINGSGGDTAEKTDDEQWDAAWSDDDNGHEEKQAETPEQGMENDSRVKRKSERGDGRKEIISSTLVSENSKRQKLTHFRSELAGILNKCSYDMKFEPVTEYLASMGPSAIDVEFSALCNGTHDLKEGLRFLHLCSMWLLEACKTRKNYEVINAYMHRFLHIHATTIAGIDASTQDEKSQEQAQEQKDEIEYNVSMRVKLLETVKEMKKVHKASTNNLRDKMQETLCLLQHFSRMV